MRQNNGIFIILGILLVLNILGGLAVYDLSETKPLEIIFFDVGQGDAIFIETPQRQQILIDGGPSSAILEKLGREMPFWDRTIDLVILSHPERDHLVGLLEILKSYQVENILWTGILRTTAEFQEWQRLIKEEKANVFVAQSGQKICFQDPDSQAFLEVLFPFESLAGKTLENSNDTSVVNRISFGDTSFLFTGDISKSTERELLVLVGAQLNSDILKISHHGSKNSNDEAFVKEVSPQIAVISAGRDNSYGHPSQETLETLKKYGIDILRTDINGDIKIVSNGKTYAISFMQN